MRQIDHELFDAVEQGNFGKVKRCLDRGDNIRTTKDYNVPLTGTTLHDD